MFDMITQCTVDPSQILSEPGKENCNLTYLIRHFQNIFLPIINDVCLKGYSSDNPTK